jgi:4-hydroxy-4-methyl-2-oxoglutarate aldolase
MAKLIPQETLAALTSLNSCSVANAIECFDVRLRNEGFTNRTIRCRLPSLPPMVGYAMTIRIRAASTPWNEENYLARNDWWTKLQFATAPYVLVVEDMDHATGTGAFIGEVHAAILQAIGCVGAVTNGSVRDLPAVERLGFPLFSGSLSVSHSYAHVVEAGGPVDVGGLRILPGDLIHGGQHGIVRVPPNIAEEIPAIAMKMHEHERRIIHYCQSPSFNLSQLHSLVKENVCGVKGSA